MKLIKTFIFTMLFFLLNQAGAMAQVIVILQQPPPYQFKVEHLWKVTLVNPTQTTYRVYLHGRATEIVDGPIVEATSTTFTLGHGTKIINPRELVPISVKEANQKYIDIVKNIGGVPTGDYEICVSVINTVDGQEIGTGCVSAQVQNLTQVELLEPGSGAVFSSRTNPQGTIWDDTDIVHSRTAVGSFLIFNWLPPTPIPPGARVTYKLRIAEIYGNQSPYDAIRSNPAFFENRNVTSTIYQYPTASRPFEAGKRYAWKVEVYLNNVFISESEIWEFSIGGDNYVEKLELAVEKIERAYNEVPSSGVQETSNLNQNLVKDHPVLLASLGLVPELLLLQDRTPGQESSDRSPLQFSGNVRFNTTLASRVASFSEQPKNQWTAELNPVLTFYGLPFTASFLLSSQQEASRQSINNFGLNFDGGEKFFMGIRSLGVGTNYPSYSEYTLGGVPVTGVNIEINPGIFYAAFTAGANQRGIDNLSYSRSLYAGRIGLGKKEGTHLYFTGLYAKDDEGSIKLDPANNTLTPKANYVFGTEAKLNLFGDKLSLQGEGALAVLTRDTRDPELEHKSIPGWVKNIVDPRISTSFDYSYSGKLAFNNDASATRISLGLKMVGPGYTSLGVPNLRTDQFGYEAKFDQRFFERRVTVGTFYKRYNDNLIQWKRSTTTTTAYGVNLGFNFPRIPFLRLSYSPYSQKNDDLNPLRKVDNTTSVYSIMTGYSYRLGNLNSSTSFTFSRQETKTVSGIGDYRTNSFMVTEAISLNIPLSFTASWGLIQTTSALGDSRINNLDLGANAQVIDGWSIMGGVNLAIEEGRNRRTGFYVSSNVSPFQGIGIDIRADRNIYTEQQGALGDYREFIFSATLTARW